MESKVDTLLRIQIMDRQVDTLLRNTNYGKDSR